MANTIIKGRDLMLFNSDGHSFGYATNHTFSMTAETSDISTKDHGVWGAVEVSRYSWEITSENLYTVEDYDALFTAMTAGTAITVRFGLKQTPSNPALTPADGSTTLPYWTSQSSYYQGQVVITNLTVNANNGENATYSITLAGVGSISKTTANADVDEGDSEE